MSTTTKVHTINRRYALYELPRLGAPIDQCTAYPQFHEIHGNDGYIVEQKVQVHNGILQVVSDEASGHYEWIYFTPRGTILYSQAGWGSIAYALQNGLNFALSEGGK